MGSKTTQIGCIQIIPFIFAGSVLFVFFHAQFFDYFF